MGDLDLTVVAEDAHLLHADIRGVAAQVDTIAAMVAELSRRVAAKGRLVA
jgi:hypothetical protein